MWQKSQKPNLAKTREVRKSINHQEHVAPPPPAPKNRPNRNNKASQRQLKSTLDVHMSGGFRQTAVVRRNEARISTNDSS